MTSNSMDILGLCLVAQLSLTFGLANLFWPEKFLPIFEVLFYPWAASYRVVRAHGLAAIGISLLLFASALSAGA